MTLKEILGVAAGMLVVIGGATGAAYILKDDDASKQNQAQALELERLRLQAALAQSAGGGQQKAPSITGIKPLDGLISGFNQIGGVNGVRSIVGGFQSLLGK